MSDQPNRVYEFGEFRVDTAERLLLRGEEQIPLTPKAFDTLLLLLEKSGRLLEKEELMNRVWAGSFVEEANLARIIWTLRKALGDSDGKHQYIETVPKLGYRFVAEVRKVPNTAVEVVVQRRIRARVVTEEEGQTALEEPEVISRRALLGKRFSTRGRAIVLGLAVVLAFVAAAVVLKKFANRAAVVEETSPAVAAEKKLARAPLLRLTNHPATDGAPSWSPDGSRIAFTSNRDGKSEIYLMNPDGSGVTRLTNNEFDDKDPAWSPDGNKISFTSERDGNP